MFCGLTSDFSGRTFYELLKRFRSMPLYGVVSICLLCLIVSWCFQVFYSLINILAVFIIHYWKWAIKASYYYYIAIYFLLYFCQCLLYIFGNPDLRHTFFISSWQMNLFIIVLCPSLSLWQFDLMCILPNIIMTFLTLIWLPFAWNFFFILPLSVYFYH